MAVWVDVAVAVYVSLGFCVCVADGVDVLVGVMVSVGVLLTKGDGVTVGDGRSVLVTMMSGVLVGSWATRVISSTIMTVGVIRGIASPLQPAMNSTMIPNANMPRCAIRFFPHDESDSTPIMTHFRPPRPLRL